MIKSYYLVLCAGLSICASAQPKTSALYLSPGTTWVSNAQTSVVLDKTGLTYDADPILLGNNFRFTGSDTAFIRGNERASLYSLTLAKPGGTLTLDQGVNIVHRVEFIDGLLDLNGNGVFLQPDALLINETDRSHFIGNLGGYIEIDLDLHAPVAANPGNLGAVITSPADLGPVHIMRGHTQQSVSGGHLGIARYFSIQCYNGDSLHSTLGFYYLPWELQGFEPDSLGLWKSKGESPWVSIGYSSRDVSRNYIEKKDIPYLDRFTLYPAAGTSSPGNPPPPPDHILLTGSWTGDFATLDWTMPSENGTDHFSVERAYAGQPAFMPIVSLPSHATGGTSPGATRYSFTDSSVETGPADVIYRVEWFGPAGQSAYSNAVILKGRNGHEFIRKCYPTVFVGARLYIQVGNMPLDKMTFTIVDAKGSVVVAGALPYQSQWLPVSRLSRGAYHLILQSGTHRYHATFIR